MTKSRTADGKHTKRFIILRKGSCDEKFTRSIAFPYFYETKELAQSAIAAMQARCPGIHYKVRQK